MSFPNQKPLDIAAKAMAEVEAVKLELPRGPVSHVLNLSVLIISCSTFDGFT